MNKSNQMLGASLLESQSIKVVRVDAFLSNQERDAIYNAVCKEQEAFKTLGHAEVGEVVTRFLSLELGKENEVKIDLIQETTEVLKKRIMAQLPALCKMLDIQSFNSSKLPITFINALDGHFGTSHADSIDGRYQISILYYFHKVPKVFNGGNLNFYAFDHEAESGHSKDMLFEVEIEDNLLIAFPSNVFHGVTQVQSHSSDFKDGRFVAVGFLGT